VADGTSAITLPVEGDLPWITSRDPRDMMFIQFQWPWGIKLASLFPSTVTLYSPLGDIPF
jgi:hypothetical protein